MNLMEMFFIGYLVCRVMGKTHNEAVQIISEAMQTALQEAVKIYEP